MFTATRLITKKLIKAGFSLYVWNLIIRDSEVHLKKVREKLKVRLERNKGETKQ